MRSRAFPRTCAVLLALCGFLWGQGSSTSARVFQEGGAGGAAAATLGSTLINSGGDGTVTEGTTIEVGASRGLLAFPRIIGTGPDQVPPGATVLSATLELHALSVAGAGSRLISVRPILDLTGAGPWQEPQSFVTQGSQVGVSWLQRDARPGINAPWGIPGGDVLFAGPPVSGDTLVPTTPSSWHSFDVTAVVNYWATGVSNLGWALTSSNAQNNVVFASDDHPNLALRPRLTVTWSGTATPYNRIPEISDTTLNTTVGASVELQLPLTDPNGQTAHYVIRERPANGEVIGNQWFSYHPNPGFVGTDRFTLYAHDGFASSALTTITINVQADPTATSAGLTGGRATSVVISTDPQNQVTEEGDELHVAANSHASFIDWPTLVGSQIPVGATVISAQLELTVTGIDTMAPTRLISVLPLEDPADLGPWFEPSGPGTVAGSGVSWLHRDARGANPSNWLIPGGDRHPQLGASATVSPGDLGRVVAFDVTSAVQQWVLGADNLGWIVESANPEAVRFGSDEASNTNARPRLLVTWRAPATQGPNLAPITSAGPDQVVWSGETITLDGSASHDPEGVNLFALWGQIEGPSVALSGATSLTTSFVAPSVAIPTRLRFLLLTTDGTRTSQDEISIWVGGSAPANQPPVALGGPDSFTLEGQWTALNGLSSYDPESAPLTYEWTQLSGPTVTVLPAVPGLLVFVAPFVTAAQAPLTLAFRLSVSDGTNTSYDYVLINVLNGTNSPPTAAVSAAQTVESEEWVGMDARGSTDPDPNTNLSLSWTQLQGPAVNLSSTTGPAPYFKAPVVSSPTALVFEVAVSDAEYTDTATTTITVEPHPIEFTGGDQSLTAYTDTLSPREARHFLRRAGYGGSAADVQQVLNQGLSATITQMMNPVPTPAIDAMADARTPSPIPGDIYPQANLRQVAEWWLVHKINAPLSNQLKEKISYFFHDLYATGGSVAGSEERHWILAHINLFRNNPLPNYRQFLIDLTRDDLMLDWLDNHRNRNGSPNENYAREFWELFTMGEIDPMTGLPNYTETEIQEASRAFTGWETYDPPENISNSRYSRFNPGRHDDGMKTFLGQTGRWKDEDVVDITLTRPQAAEFIVTNLFRFFIHENPSVGTIQALANQLRTAGYELAPVVETILKSQAMFSATALKNRIKTPTEFMVGLLRESELDLEVEDVYLSMASMGQVMGSPPSVKGWAEGSFWLGEAAMAYRAEAANRITTARTLQAGADLSHLLPPPALRGSASTLSHLMRIFDIGEINDAQFQALIEYMDTRPLAGGGSVDEPFNGNNADHVDRKLRGVLFILAFAASDYHLN